MSRLLLTIAALFTFALAQGQSALFTLKDYTIYPRSRAIHGVSGIEYIPQRQEWQLVGDRGQYYNFRNIHQLADFIRQPDPTSQTGLYLEALRYDAASDRYFFAVENNTESYVGFSKHLPLQPGDTVTRLPLPHAMPSPKTNKGIEGLALTANALWVAPEGGSAEEATVDNPRVHFYRYRKTGDTLAYDAEFAYDMDRNLCPSEPLGGISEIIAVPGDDSRLLVLERCYNSVILRVTARLYEARIDEANRRLDKRLAFDFNGREGLQPDNLEGMTWADDEDGHKILVVISDDNDNKTQWTQIVRLQMQ